MGWPDSAGTIVTASWKERDPLQASKYPGTGASPPPPNPAISASKFPNRSHVPPMFSSFYQAARRLFPACPDTWTDLQWQTDHPTSD